MVLKSSNMYLVVDLAHFDKAKKYQNRNRYGIEAPKSSKVSKFCRKFISTSDQDIDIKSNQYCGYAMICVSIHEGYMLYRCCIS